VAVVSLRLAMAARLAHRVRSSIYLSRDVRTTDGVSPTLSRRPFGEEIREHLIPLLSSPVWWEQTIAELRSLFELDPAFNMPMFAHQVAVVRIDVDHGRRARR
jgi:hypothetical protein